MIKTYGQQQAGKQASEANEMTTFFGWMKRNYSEYHKVAIHVRNEHNGNGDSIGKAKMQGGFIKGTCDILVIAKTPFACECKSLSKKATVYKEQIAFLEQVDKMGGFACICYGHQAMIQAFEEWIKENPL